MQTWSHGQKKYTQIYQYSVIKVFSSNSFKIQNKTNKIHATYDLSIYVHHFQKHSKSQHSIY